jgi:hypothetical protein
MWVQIDTCERNGDASALCPSLDTPQHISTARTRIDDPQRLLWLGCRYESVKEVQRRSIRERKPIDLPEINEARSEVLI